jgi:hypothetical protein
MTVLAVLIDIPAEFTRYFCIGGECVENQRATGRIAEHAEEGGLVIAKDLRNAAGGLVSTCLHVAGLLQAQAQEHGNDRRDGTNEEREAPTPQFQLRLIEHLLQDNDDEHGQQLASDQRNVLER